METGYLLILDDEPVIIKKLIEEQFLLGAELQKTILKVPVPQTRWADFFLTYEPKQELKMGGDTFILLIGDVAGHGIKAAFLTGLLMSGPIDKDYNRKVISTAKSMAFENKFPDDITLITVNINE